MPPSDIAYTLPTDAPTSVLNVDGIGYGFISKFREGCFEEKSNTGVCCLKTRKGGCH